MADDTTTMTPSPSPDNAGLPTRNRRLSWYMVELLAVCSLGIAQPTLSLLGDNPAFFVAHRMYGSDLIMFAVLLMIIPTTALWFVVLVMDAIRPRVAAVLQSIFVGCILSAAIAPPVAAKMPGADLLWILLLMLIAVEATILVRRHRALRSMVRFLALSPVLFLAFFIFASPASGLIRDSYTAETSGLGTEDTPPVVWLVLDQFPMSFVVDSRGQIDAERMPNLARLAATSTWYSQALTVSPNTISSVPAALSGRMPKPGAAPAAFQYPQNLFTILGGNDYPLHLQESVTDLCPPVLCGKKKQSPSTWPDTRVVFIRYLLPPSVADRFVPRIDDRWDAFGVESANQDDVVDGSTGTTLGAEPLTEAESDANVRKFTNFIEPLQEPELRGLHYAHLLMPHDPLRYLPDGRTLLLAPTIGAFTMDKWPDDEAATRGNLQRALGQTMNADRLVGEVLDTLERTGTLDEVVLVVMSDHGISFRPGVKRRSLREPDSSVDTAPQMMFIKAPGQRTGEIDTRWAQQIDLLPTVLEHLQINTTSLRLDGLAMKPAHQDEWIHRQPRRVSGDHYETLEPYTDPPLAKDSPTITWIDETFLHTADPYRTRPLGELLGTAVDTSLLEDSGLSTRLERGPTGPIRFDDIDTKGPSIPALIGGRLPDESTPDGAFIGVVLNGVLAGIAESYHLDRREFSVLVDPIYFRDGTNTIEVVVTDPIERSAWRQVDLATVIWQTVKID